MLEGREFPLFNYAQTEFRFLYRSGGYMCTACAKGNFKKLRSLRMANC